MVSVKIVILVTGFHLIIKLKICKNEILNLKNKFPEKKIFLMGESMGGAIVVSLANQKQNFTN